MYFNILKVALDLKFKYNLNCVFSGGVHNELMNLKNKALPNVPVQSVDVYLPIMEYNMFDDETLLNIFSELFKSSGLVPALKYRQVNTIGVWAVDERGSCKGQIKIKKLPKKLTVDSDVTPKGMIQVSEIEQHLAERLNIIIKDKVRYTVEDYVFLYLITTFAGWNTNTINKQLPQDSRYKDVSKYLMSSINFTYRSLSTMYGQDKAKEMMLTVPTFLKGLESKENKMWVQGMWR